MKCEKCGKPATFHITELTEGKPEELHLCEDHAREYLTQTGGDEPVTPGSMAAALTQQMTQQMSMGQTTEELDQLDRRECPVCGVTFYEFRSQGRLGCPNDYSCFEQQLETLIQNIHGVVEHSGKTPKRSPDGSRQRTQLIRLRREMTEAVQSEQYEKASKLRDMIRGIEHPQDE